MKTNVINSQDVCRKLEDGVRDLMQLAAFQNVTPRTAAFIVMLVAEQVIQEEDRKGTQY